MTPHDWVNRAHQFLDTDGVHCTSATTEAELRLAMMDIHSALDDTLRWYLTAEYGARNALDKSEASFPMVVQLLRQHTGSMVVDGEAES